MVSTLTSLKIYAARLAREILWVEFSTNSVCLCLCRTTKQSSRYLSQIFRQPKQSWSVFFFSCFSLQLLMCLLALILLLVLTFFACAYRAYTYVCVCLSWNVLHQFGHESSWSLIWWSIRALSQSINCCRQVVMARNIYYSEQFVKKIKSQWDLGGEITD